MVSGRVKEHKNGCCLMSISLDHSILKIVDEQATKAQKSRSGFIRDVIETFVSGNKNYCDMMAKKAAQELNYWQDKKLELENKKQ